MIFSFMTEIIANEIIPSDILKSLMRHVPKASLLKIHHCNFLHNQNQMNLFFTVIVPLTIRQKQVSTLTIASVVST